MKPRMIVAGLLTLTAAVALILWLLPHNQNPAKPASMAKKPSPYEALITEIEKLEKENPTAAKTKMNEFLKSLPPKLQRYFNSRTKSASCGRGHRLTG